MKTDEDIKNIKKFFKKEVAVNFNSETTHSFCLGYIVALFNNDLITEKQKLKLIKYCDKRL